MVLALDWCPTPYLFNHYVSSFAESTKPLMVAVPRADQFSTISTPWILHAKSPGLASLRPTGPEESRIRWKAVYAVSTARVIDLCHCVTNIYNFTFISILCMGGKGGALVRLEH